MGTLLDPYFYFAFLNSLTPQTHTHILTHRVCYERVKFSPTMATFVLSAWWHGLYPGYYLCFVSGAIFNEAARKVSI